jgi:hypothetical protein
MVLQLEQLYVSPLTLSLLWVFARLSPAEGGQVAIFDATNTTKERRQQLVRRLLLFVGTVWLCDVQQCMCSPQLTWQIRCAFDANHKCACTISKLPINQSLLLLTLLCVGAVSSVDDS